MQAHRTALITAALILLANPAASPALELGVQDDWAMSNHPATILNAGHQLNAEWVRMIFRVGDPIAADRIRTAHAQGFKVLVTLGGIGTITRHPSARQLLAYLRTLPKAERYTVINEPDLANLKRACTYRKTWMAVRRVIGRRLLFGDFSPHAPLTFTTAVRMCGPLPKHLGFALHPYQWTDPLAPGPDEGGIGNLGKLRRGLHRLGLTVDYWLDEFGYIADVPVGRARIVPDEQAAAMWPRAILQANRHHARILGIYMAEGPSWDSRPREGAWASLTGHAPLPVTMPSVPTRFDPNYY